MSSQVPQSAFSIKLKKSARTLEEAHILLSSGFMEGAVNRLYYACFHLLSALLISEGHLPKSHNGVRTIFFQMFIKTGIFEKELVDILFHHHGQKD